ncbi:glycosyltransferase [Sulfurimonas lithotrophica]|uniref:Glycosyltransferase n=1 Tax=Sulfurimonas lithotrophica TaxID=2590022 RepID=A0A5P8NZ11_9BACT|nr:glycosyltransferase [Sulfurimonas lithotrophica]QFR48661.1 glycosyltransferase [Sulfurimonas lithotrophica]
MNTSNPLVSIIIPFYNHNDYIYKTLDSVLEDKYSNKEIVIINDGSSNPNDSNITKWIDKNSEIIKIKYIKRENKGLTKTLNELISLAKGKYILLCASDDYLINNTIKSRVDILENNPDKYLLLSDAIVIDENNNIIYESSLFDLYKGKKENYFNDDGLKTEITSNWSVAGATHLIRKELYDLVGLYDENLLVEDYDFFLRVVARDFILYYDEKVSAYRRHETNVSGDILKELKMFKEIKKVVLKNLYLFDDKYKHKLLTVVEYYEDKMKNYYLRNFIRIARKKTKRHRDKVKKIFRKKK